MITGRYTVKEVLTGSLRKGEDLLENLTEMCKSECIKAGHIEVLGAVKRANIGFFNQKSSQFDTVMYKKNMQIIACSGTVIEKSGIPVVHLHISLSDEEGNMFGGHLKEETILFSGEYTLTVYNEKK